MAFSLSSWSWGRGREKREASAATWGDTEHMVYIVDWYGGVDMERV